MNRSFVPDAMGQSALLLALKGAPSDRRQRPAPRRTCISAGMERTRCDVFKVK